MKNLTHNNKHNIKKYILVLPSQYPASPTLNSSITSPFLSSISPSWAALWARTQINVRLGIAGYKRLLGYEYSTGGGGCEIVWMLDECEWWWWWWLCAVVGPLPIIIIIEAVWPLVDSQQQPPDDDRDRLDRDVELVGDDEPSLAADVVCCDDIWALFVDAVCCCCCCPIPVIGDMSYRPYCCWWWWLWLFNVVFEFTLE